MIPKVAEGAARNTLHSCAIFVGHVRISAVLETGSCVWVGIVAVGASSSLHTFAQVIIPEVVVGTSLHATFGGDVDIVVRGRRIRTYRYAGEVAVCIGVIGAG